MLATTLFPSHTVLFCAKCSSSFKTVQQSSQKVSSYSIPKQLELMFLMYFIADREDVFNNLSVAGVLGNQYN